MIDLSQKKDPFITQSVEQGFYNASNGLNLHKANFRFAIGAFSLNFEARNDPRYVKWFARLNGFEDGQHKETVLPVHTCTQEDYE